jgi:hypothetical protein
MPEEPLQPFRSRLSEFSSQDREKKTVFGPETRKHAFAEYELRVPMDVIMDLVRSDGGFIDGVLGAK